jgi:DnaA family protein
MLKSPSQLPLTFGQAEVFSLDQFLAGRNDEVLQKLNSAIDRQLSGSIFIWGSPGSGKSHLLQALCKSFSDNDQQSVYLPLSQHKKFTSQILEGLEVLPVICLDDVEQVAGDENWERAIFNLFNRIREENNLLVMAARSAPQSIEFKLSDLGSRMNWGLIYQLKDLDDREKLMVLQQRAKSRGFKLTDEVGNYLITRLPRGMHALCDFLDKLDVASLAAKRKLTIPFVKELLEQDS